MTYRNGYTSTPEILAMKKEIRKIKIDINRLASITLDYADEITDNGVAKGRLPKPIEHILVATKHMNERIEELALKIKRERNKISDANPTLNRNYFKCENSNLNLFTEAFKGKLGLSRFTNTLIESTNSMILSSGFNSIVIKEIKDIWDRPQNTTFAFRDREYIAKAEELFVKAKLFGLSELSKFIESNINDIQVNTDNSNLYIVFTTSSKSTFLVYFNF